MTRSELKRLREQVEALPPKAPPTVTPEAARQSLLSKIAAIKAKFAAMTPEEIEAWEREHPTTPEVQELLDRMQRLAKLESRPE